MERQTLAVALSYVLDQYGIERHPASIKRDLPDYATPESIENVVPQVFLREVGQYGTYPAAAPSIIRFEDGSYHYVVSPADRLITDSHDLTDKQMAHYGTPVAWYAFARKTVPALDYEPDDPIYPEMDDPAPIPPPSNILSYRPPAARPKTTYTQNVFQGVKYEYVRPDKKLVIYYVGTEHGTIKQDFANGARPRPIGELLDRGQYVSIIGRASHTLSAAEWYLTPEDFDPEYFTQFGRPRAAAGYPVEDMSAERPEDPVPEEPTEPEPVPLPTAPKHVTQREPDGGWYATNCQIWVIDLVSMKPYKVVGMGATMKIAERVTLSNGLEYLRIHTQHLANRQEGWYAIQAYSTVDGSPNMIPEDEMYGVAQEDRLYPHDIGVLWKKMKQTAAKWFDIIPPKKHK